MKIIPTRTMRLGGEHVERAVPVDVSDADGAHAIRHGWAVAAPAKPARGERKSADADATAPAAD